MEDKMKDKENLYIKKSPGYKDFIELTEYLDPIGIKNLYFIVVGILTTRGYKFIDWFSVGFVKFKVGFNNIYL